MEKISILCGMENRQKAEKFMAVVVEGIQSRNFSVTDIDDRYLVLTTKYTQTAFIYDERVQSLYGVKADAIFGFEPYKQKLAVYLKEMMPYNIGKGLVDYICECEKNGPTAEAKEAYKAASEMYDRAIERHIHNAIRDGFVSYSQSDCDMTYGLYKKYMNNTKPTLPEIKDVIFNNPATIVFWADGTKTVVQSRGSDPYDPEKGLAMAISKKIMGNKHEYYHAFLHWLKKV